MNSVQLRLDLTSSKLLKLPQSKVDNLMEDAELGVNASVSIDLESQKIISADGSQTSFEIDSFRKYCLLNGLDDIGLTMEKDAKIGAYEKKIKASQPWL